MVGTLLAYREVPYNAHWGICAINWHSGNRISGEGQAAGAISATVRSWRDLVDVGDGSESTYRQVHDAPLDEHGEVEGWQRWPTIARANPLVGLNPHLGPKLKDELAKALRSDVLRPRFITYRLNRPIQVAAEVLFTVEAWKRIEAREIGSDMGTPICGIDRGESKAYDRTWTQPSNRETAIERNGCNRIRASVKRSWQRFHANGKLRQRG